MTEETQNGEQPESDFPEAWKPSAGDTLTGVLVEVRMIDPSGQGPYPCVTLRTADGDRAIHAFHSVLRRELARAAPKVDDEITVSYLGAREGGQFGKYHSYRVRGGQGGEFDWSSQLPPEERAASSVPIEPAPVRTPEEADAARRQQAEEAQRQTQAAAEKNFGSEVPF